MESGVGNLIVFTGPSGVGKGTIVRELFKEVDKLGFSVSVTTREKRAGEEDGKNYFFRTHEEFDELIEKDRLLEWAEFVGNKYGTPKDFVFEKLKSGNDVLLEIEVQGAIQVKEKFPDAVMIFLVPPSLNELEARLRKRNTETDEKIKLRLAKAKEEMQHTEFFEYIVINDDAMRAAKDVKNVILSLRGKKKIKLDLLEEMLTESEA
ncbi:MAG: guanylate kinase [Candidatus Caenarcaniphilales bacterium]|nr:guanylate kinase [Candidatus Caenarcaniphilales bacterium]